MRDPRQSGIDPNKLLVAAAIGLALFLIAGLVFGQGLPAGTRFEPRDALLISCRARTSLAWPQHKIQKSTTTIL